MTTAEILKFFEKAGLPKPVAEFEFHPTRGWKFDFAWPAQRVALEVDGGIHSGGRHIQPEGFLKDKEKFNHAAALGWRPLFCTPRSVISFGMVELLKQALAYQPGAVRLPVGLGMARSEEARRYVAENKVGGHDERLRCSKMQR